MKNLLSWQHCWADIADGAISAYPPAAVLDECEKGHGWCDYADGADCTAVTGHDLHGGVVESVKIGAVWVETSWELRADAPFVVSADTLDTAVLSVSR